MALMFLFQIPCNKNSAMCRFHRNSFIKTIIFTSLKKTNSMHQGHKVLSFWTERAIAEVHIVICRFLWIWMKECILNFVCKKLEE